MTENNERFICGGGRRNGLAIIERESVQLFNGFKLFLHTGADKSGYIMASFYFF